MVFADTLSRAHLDEFYEDIPEEELNSQIHMVVANNNVIPDTKLEEVKINTEQDRTLCEIKKYVISGWPRNRKEIPDIVKPYWSYREELTIINGIVYKGERIVIPEVMRRDILKKIHQAHLGMEKTKLRARETIFWPGINKHIEDLLKACETCLRNSKKQVKEQLLSSEIPVYPFQIVGTDLFHWNNQRFILLVDYYSRYWEIERLHDAKSETIIKNMKMIFSRLGIPQVVRSDNGPEYVSKEFSRFSKEWEFRHVTSSPYHPKSNGMTERYVQVAKNALTKAMESKQDLHLALLEIRNTPVDGYASPAQLLCGRRLNSLIPESQASEGVTSKFGRVSVC